MARKIIRLRAYLDAVDFADFFARNNLAASTRFLDAFDKTCKKLGESPGLGSPWESDFAERIGLLYWPVESFPNHLIFFRKILDGIEILRVFHASRNLRNILEELPP